MSPKMTNWNRYQRHKKLQDGRVQSVLSSMFQALASNPSLCLWWYFQEQMDKENDEMISPQEKIQQEVTIINSSIQFTVGQFDFASPSTQNEARLQDTRSSPLIGSAPVMKETNYPHQRLICSGIDASPNQ